MKVGELRAVYSRKNLHLYLIRHILDNQVKVASLMLDSSRKWDWYFSEENNLQDPLLTTPEEWEEP